MVKTHFVRLFSVSTLALAVVAGAGFASLTTVDMKFQKPPAATTTAAPVATVLTSARNIYYPLESYNYVLAGKRRAGVYYYLAVENVGAEKGSRLVTQVAGHRRNKPVSIGYGQVRTVRVRVGKGNPLIRMYQRNVEGADLLAGMFPSKKGAFTLPSDRHPAEILRGIRNTTGHRAVLNLAFGAPYGPLGWGTATGYVKPGASATLSKKLKTSKKRHMVACWGDSKAAINLAVWRLDG